MFELDAFHLARIQFAFTVSFHILFPAITIGLASYLVVLAKNFRRQLWYGRGFRAGDGLPVWD